MRTMPSAGALLCLASAAAFGAMGIFGKLAYDEGASVGTLLATRFVLAAVLFWLVVACSGRARELRALSRRDAGIALALGAIGYSAQAGGYFAALDRLDASLLSLLVYTFPAIVTVSAIALGRERASWRTALALALASTGLVLVLAGAAAGALDPLGTALGLFAAVVYSAYILTSEGIAARIGPLALSTLVCTGAATTLTLGGVVTGDLDPGGVSAQGFGWLAGLAVVSTVGAVGLFFAGLQRVGPTAASILSTLEPVVTVVLAFVVFGESLGPTQLAGGALVLLAVLAVRTPVRVAVSSPPSPAGAGA
jgi:drug/metabolite transporter (DMT)-like permease